MLHLPSAKYPIRAIGRKTSRNWYELKSMPFALVLYTVATGFKVLRTNPASNLPGRRSQGV